MKQRALFLFTIIFTVNISAQDLYKEFKLQKPELKISNSQYNTIVFLDSRVDTTNMGVVQIGITNKHGKVITKIPLQAQLNEYLNAIIDSTSGTDTLIFQIRQFLFAETTAFSSEIGYCYLRANLFSKSKNDGYRKLSSIDTMVLVKSMDVTNALMKTGSHLITDMIIQSLQTPYNGTEICSYNEVFKIDSLEKRKIKLYNTEVYVDGLYYNYNSFKDQIPDNKVIVKWRKDQTINSVGIPDKNNDYLKLKSDSIYAFVYQGKPFISTGYGYYPLYKGDDYFYFVGSIKPMTPDRSNVLVAGAMFGLIGAIVASSLDVNGMEYFIIIDHNNGGFIQYKKMPPKKFQ